jgi:para-nitrobenzyl esterase
LYAWTPEDYAVSQTVQSYWARFIQTGDPNAPGLPEWPRYDTGQRMTLDVTSRAGPDSEAARRKALDPLIGSVDH